MPVQLRHKRLAKPHHFGIGAAMRVEIRSALRAANGHPGKRVFKDLLKTEKLYDSQIHRGVKPQSTLIRPERGIKFHPKSAVNVHVARAIGPRHPENDRPLRAANPPQHTDIGVSRTL